MNMPQTAALRAAALLLLAAAPAWASAQSQTAKEVPEPKVQHLIQEDDQVRVEELRVRGQTQQVTVTPKNSRLPAYEIQAGEGGRDVPLRSGEGRGTAGQRVWRLFNF
ncbi:hypothetical protein LZ017_11280 [Pelomonas sp. CA6]|uniref:hypothetical protein n=1 Tax=Pelomonas sp. CA6 TaxID=2907999 RepID=UPI001F4C3223|nr:hypothetical protein [Pelomonas sp. CA6]MCH7343961.1 hypothetical protein [Pelomonas sp. CA6]